MPVTSGPGAAARNALEGGPRIAFDAGDLGVGLGPLDILDGAVVWFVPAATIAGPGLLLLLVVALQSAGAMAWIPAVRRLRGSGAPKP